MLVWVCVFGCSYCTSLHNNYNSSDTLLEQIDLSVLLIPEDQTFEVHNTLPFVYKEVFTGIF